MVSARFEEALQAASEEELRSFFATLPQSVRRRLMAVLTEVEAAAVQHFLDSHNPAASDDLAELDWPSEPDAQPARQPTPAPSSESSDASLESWGIFGMPVRPAAGAVFGSVQHQQPHRPAQVPPVPVPAAASSSSDPAPLHLQQAAAAGRAAAPAAPPPSSQPASSSGAAAAMPGSAFLGPEASVGMPSASPTVPPPPDLSTGLDRQQPVRPYRRRLRVGPPCGLPCDNPRCTDTCPRVDDPTKRGGHRHHACDACHRRGW